MPSVAPPQAIFAQPQRLDLVVARQDLDLPGTFRGLVAVFQQGDAAVAVVQQVFGGAAGGGLTLGLFAQDGEDAFIQIATDGFRHRVHF